MHLLASTGAPLYDAMAEDFTGAAEMIFASLVYPERTDAAAALFVKKRHPAVGTSQKLRLATFKKLRSLANALIEDLVGTLCRENVECVGSSATFNQLFSTVALGRALKERSPQTAVVAGGPCFAGDVGLAFLHEYPYIDYMVHGEGEEPLVKLLDALAEGTHPNSTSILVNPRLTQTPAAPAFGVAPTFDERPTLEELPTPYYDGYAPLADAAGVSWAIPVEGSRGCWWDRVRRTGDLKDTCQFCNLNVLWGPYREKSTKRIVGQIKELAERYNNHRIYFVDNVARVKGLDRLAHEIASLGMELEIFYEMRANVTPIEFLELWEAGLRQVQIGIEGLSTSYLKRVNKGTTLLQNLQVMKLACEFGIYNYSNFVSEFPGSTEAEVEETVTAIRRYAIPFQPLQMSPFALQEGTPVAGQPERYGITNIRPLPGYVDTLPEGVSSRLRFPWLAFDCTLPTADWSPVRKAVEQWRKRWKPEPRLLRYHDCGTFLVIIDQRAGDYREGQFDRIRRDIYMYCAEIRAKDQIRGRFPSLHPNEIEEILQEFSALGIMASENDRYLALAMAENQVSAARRIRAAASESPAAVTQPQSEARLLRVLQS